MLSFLYSPTLTSIHDTGKTIALTRWTFVVKIMSLLFNMLSRWEVTFLPWNKHLLISWLQTPSSVLLQPQNKVSHCLHGFPIYLPRSVGKRYHALKFFECRVLSQFFSLSCFTLIKKVFSCSSLSAISVVLSACLRLLIFLPLVIHPARHFI